MIFTQQMWGFALIWVLLFIIFVVVNLVIMTINNKKDN